MSTLTSLIKSGKRRLAKTMSSQPALEHEQESVEAIQVSPVISGSSAPIQTALGRPDQGTSLDVTRPQRDAPNLYGQTALGRPDQEASHDVTRP